MAIVLSTLKIIIYRSISTPDYVKDVVDGLNARDKKYLREQMNRLSKHLTTTCEFLVMLHYDSNKLTVDFLITMQRHFNRGFSHCR